MQLDLMLGQQVNVLLRHAPVPPQAVKAIYQYHIHPSSKNGLRHLLQSRTIKGHSRTILGGDADNGIPGLLRITAKLIGLQLQRKPIIVGNSAVNVCFHRIVPPLL